MKSRGETLLEAWMPLHPATHESMASKTVARMRFQFHFTGGTIETVKVLAIKNSSRFRFILLATIHVAIGCVLIAEPPWARAANDENSLADRAERAFVSAKQSAGRERTNIAALIRLSRAAFEWAEFSQSGDQRAEVATRGIEAARTAIQKADTNAAAHYWLAMNLGQLARTKSLGALKLVREMETEFLRARALDPRVDFAGPDRSLGFLYRDAPGWPTSIGNRKKSRAHFEAAVKLEPDFPDNQLALAESFFEWGDKQSFSRQLEAAESVMGKARPTFTGADWEASWADWNKRLSVLKSKAVSKPSQDGPKGAK